METYTLDEICYLDLKTWTWSRSWTFVARFDHSTWIWGGRIWVFGGLGPDMVCKILREFFLFGTEVADYVISREQEILPLSRNALFT